VDRDSARRVVLGTFYLILLLITADELFVEHRTPEPSRYIGATVAWFVMSLIADAAPGAGAGFAILATVAFGLNNSSLLAHVPGLKTTAGAGAKGGGPTPATSPLGAKGGR
jgi:hypothetical protein